MRRLHAAGLSGPRGGGAPTGARAGAQAAEYRGILAAFPGYTDARLRCAALARARGDLEAAVAEAQARPGGPSSAGPERIPGARSLCCAPCCILRIAELPDDIQLGRWRHPAGPFPGYDSGECREPCQVNLLVTRAHGHAPHASTPCAGGAGRAARAPRCAGAARCGAARARPPPVVAVRRQSYRAFSHLHCPLLVTLFAAVQPGPGAVEHRMVWAVCADLGCHAVLGAVLKRQGRGPHSFLGTLRLRLARRRVRRARAGPRRARRRGRARRPVTYPYPNTNPIPQARCTWSSATTRRRRPASSRSCRRRTPSTTRTPGWAWPRSTSSPRPPSAARREPPRGRHLRKVSATESAAPACPARLLIRRPLGSCRALEAMPPLVRCSWSGTDASMSKQKQQQMQRRSEQQQQRHSSPPRYARDAPYRVRSSPQPSQRAQPEAAAKAAKQFARALDAYRRVLERGESNAFAANGIGAVLAEQGHLGAARDIFTQVCGGVHALRGGARMLACCLAAARRRPSVRTSPPSPQAAGAGRAGAGGYTLTLPYNAHAGAGGSGGGGRLAAPAGGGAQPGERVPGAGPAGAGHPAVHERAAQVRA